MTAPEHVPHHTISAWVCHHTTDSPLKTCGWTASIDVDVEQPSQSLEVKAMLPCGCVAYVEGEHSSTVACTDASLRAQLHKSHIDETHTQKAVGLWNGGLKLSPSVPKYPLLSF